MRKIIDHLPGSLVPALLAAALIIKLTVCGAFPQSPAKPGLPKVQFVDIAREAGLTARHITGDEQNKEYLIEVNGSGVALFDYNKDDLLDVFLVNGTTLEGFPKGARAHQPPVPESRKRHFQGCHGRGRVGPNGLGTRSLRRRC